MKYTYILFDADETLLDFSKAEAFALSEALKHEGVTCTDEVAQAYKTINKQLWTAYEQGKISQDKLRTERFERLFRELGLTVGSGVGPFSSLYTQFLGKASFLVEGAAQVCRDLIDSGLRLAIITNGIKEVQMSRIQGSELAGCFEAIIVSEETGYHKPQRGIFDYAFNKLRLTDKNRVLLVGDSLSSDIRGGADYGIDTCWFNPQQLPNASGVRPTYEIHRLEQIRELVAGV